MKGKFEKLYMIVSQEDARRICDAMILQAGDMFIPAIVLNQVLERNKQTFEEWLYQNIKEQSSRCIAVEAVFPSGLTHETVEKDGTLGVWWRVLSDIPLMSCTEVLPIKKHLN